MNRSFDTSTSPARRTTLAGLLVVAGAAAWPRTAHAFPDRPLRVIHPYAGGGPGDLLTRELAAGLQAELGQTVVAENRPGGGTVIGADAIAKSPPDGHSILIMGPATHVIMPAIHPKLPYHADRDFALIGMFAVVGNMISVHPSVPVSTLKELIDYARANPDKLNYSSGGIGSGPHLAGETFKQMTGTRLTHVPYKGAGPATVGTVGGEVQVTFVNIPPQVPFIKSGRLKPIAVATSARSSQLPDVPTAAEAGLPGFLSESWYGLAVPSATPQAVRDTLQRALFKVGADTERRSRLAGLGVEVKVMGPADLDAYVSAERRRLEPVLKTLNLSVD